MLAKRALAAIAVGLGFLSTTSQVIILRELLVAFTGNELTLATTLAVWLLSVAAGCFAFRRSARSGNPPVASLLFIIAAPTVVFQVILVRLLDPFAGTLGEIMSPLAVLGLSVITVVPGALVLGGLFAALVAIAARSSGPRVVPMVYGYEALGSAGAGALLSIYVFRGANGFVGLALAGLASLACAGCFIMKGRPRIENMAPLIAICTAGLVGVILMSDRIDLSTRGIQWRPLNVVATDETRYGNILVTNRDGVYDFFESGSFSHTIPDPLYAEESAHIPLLYHPAPRRVLAIGGAGSGIIGEIGKHPDVRAVDFVELDPKAIELTGRLAPAGWLAGPPGTEVTPVYGDARKYVQDTGESYDVVILGVGLPVTLQTARYYTVEFFSAVRHILEPEGILAFKIPSGGAYVGPELGALLASLKNSCEEVFGEVILLPGDYIHFIASPDRDLAGPTASLPSLLEERQVETSFIDPYRLAERLNPHERAQLDSAVVSYDTGIVNSDTRPVSAAYAVARWAKHFHSGRFLAAWVGSISLPACVLGLLISALVVVPLLMRATGAPRSTLPGTLALYSMGLTAMLTQILIIVAFQIANGYVYGWIAAIIAAFMVGMGLASSLVGARRITFRWYQLGVLVAALAALPQAAVGILELAASGSSGMSSRSAELSFIALAFASGALGGTIFAASSVFITRRAPRVLDAGVLAYALDLGGATVAGFTTGFLIIPSLGLAGSATAVSIFNGALLAAILISGALTTVSTSRRELAAESD